MALSRSDYSKLFDNWTCNPDVIVFQAVMPIKNFPDEKESFPQDLHYILLTQWVKH